MNMDEALLRVIDALNSLEIPYMIVGSYSSNYYGVARLTLDADIVVQIDAQSITRLRSTLAPDLKLSPQMAFEGVTMTTRLDIESSDGNYAVELFLIGDDEHDQVRFNRRRQVRFLGREAILPTPEDVLITKARWMKVTGREKDRFDIQGVISLRGDALDWPYIYSWADKHGTRQLLDNIRSKVPKI